jgi:2-polyprenyl-3-methyl-5-hydroxy-6-metoxy-1,4-benzoquinol methylase
LKGDDYPRRVTRSEPSTRDASYTQRLLRLSGARWKSWVDVQAPYRWNLRRLHLGRVLDVGCGLGRNLANLGGNGVGVDHNETSVAAARDAGWTAHTTAEFATSEDAVRGGFDSLLVAHVLEHLTEEEADRLLKTYLPYVRPGGQIVVITPQERGFRSDETHVRFVDAELSAAHLRHAGIAVERSYSFPFPRTVGRVFPYNEFVVVGRVVG